MGVQFLHARDYGAHLMSANTLRGGGERLKWMVWLGFGYLFDLRSVFRNCLVKRIAVGDSFAYRRIWECARCVRFVLGADFLCKATPPKF